MTTSTKFHVHDIHLHHGQLEVSFGTDNGRPVSMTIDREDHPALNEAYERFTETLCLAGEKVMLDLLGGIVPDRAPEPRRMPCRICDEPVTEGDPGTHMAPFAAYCARHNPNP